MKTSASDHVRDQIEQDIVVGVYQPGDKLDEASLARRFDTSRTPVREALRQLVSSGLIEMQANRGCFVRKLGATELVEMFEVMAELEALCCKLAARRASTEDLAALRALNDACLAAASESKPDEYYYANEKFHQMIYRVSGSGFLENQSLALSLKLKPYRRLQLRTRNRVTSSSQEHLAILEALDAGDPDRAAQAMRDHILVQGERFSDFVWQLKDFDTERASTAAKA